MTWPVKMSAAENSGSKLVCPKDVTHGTELLLKLKSEPVLSDVTLCADDGREIIAHKCVLAAASEYFKAMFAGDMAEKQQSSVTLHDISGQILQLIVDYIYTGDVVITGDNVQIPRDLLVAADRFQMLSIREKCCTFLSQNLTLTNYVDIIVLAKRHSCQQLYDYVCRYCKEHFSDIPNSKSFGDVPMSTLIELISSDDLNVNSEERVYHSVISWVESDLDTRRAHLPKLLSYVRLPLLNKKFLVDEVKREQLITSDSECVQLVMDAMSYHLLEPSDRSNRWTLIPRVRERQAIVIYGGRSDSNSLLNDGACYDVITKEWKDFDLTTPLPVCAGAAVVGEKMYILGGFRRDSGGQVFSDDVYSTVDGRHFQRGCHAMAAARFSHGVTVLNDKIYVAGGHGSFDIASPLHSAEVYDPDLDQWRSIASLNVPRTVLGLAAVSGCLFAVGGVGINGQKLSSVERYDPSTDQWSLVSSMSVARFAASVAALGDRVYALGGGTEGSVVTKSCEVYDPLTDTWSPIADMNVPRCYAGVVALNGELYVCGGNESLGAEHTITSTVERYNPHTNTWHMEGGMSKPREAFTIGVIKHPTFTAPPAGDVIDK